MPEDLTQVAVSLRFALFNVAFDDDVPGVTRQFSDDSVDAWRATLLARHHFGDGLAADIQIPTGTVGAQGAEGTKSRLNGFGDIRLGLRYDLSAIWGAGGYRPSVIVVGGASLPTGEQARFGELNSAIPVTVLALGRGAFSGSVRVEATQAVAKWLLLKGWLGGDLPLTPNGLGITNGLLVDAGAGVVGLPFDWFNIGGNLVAQHLQNAQSPEFGIIQNSGGTTVAVEVNAGLRILDKTFVNVGARAPAVAFLNGRQVGETFSIFASVATSFGGADDEDDHDHGDGHNHDGHGTDHGDSHAHGANSGGHGDGHAPKAHSDGHPDGDHDHAATGEDHHGDHDEDGHQHDGHQHDAHAVPARSPDGVATTADIQDAARGGETFVVADVVVPGKVTVIDFWAEWCEPCKGVDALLKKMAHRHADLAVRKVEIPTFETPAALDHVAMARGLPVVWIYDRNGTRVATLEAADLEVLKKMLIEQLGNTSATH